MIARVVEIDLTQPLTDLVVDSRYHMVWGLVRYGRRPIGWLRLWRSLVGGVVSPDMQRMLLSEGLGAQVIDAISRRAHLLPQIQHTPSFSIVICTREHPEQLERQLQSISKLVYPNFETVVVDNAPRTDRTRNVCEKYDFARYVLEPRKGLDFARNAGWGAARNEIVAYTDDDACVDPNWLSALGQAYSDQRVRCVTGITFPLELETPAQMLFENYGGMQRGFERKVYRPGTWNAFFPLGSGRFGAGVNLSVKRATLEEMGGFDPALDVGSMGRGGGDLDMMARVLRDGGTLVYEPAAIVWHQHRRTMRELRRQMFDYGWGFCAYCTKHMDDLELGNLSLRMLRRWTGIWAKKRLVTNLKLAMRGKTHFPVHLILIEILGGILGMRAYKRSVRNAIAVDRRVTQQLQQGVAA